MKPGRIPQWLACSMIAAALAGCSTPNQTARKSNPFDPIWHAYVAQDYGRALDRIESLMVNNQTRVQQAALLSIRALCQEEMGNKVGTKATLDLILTSFPSTTFAERARKRLDQQDGDQLEHWELKMNQHGWIRAVKEWNHVNLRVAYTPDGKSPTNSVSYLWLNSSEKPSGIKTAEDVISRSEADFHLHGGLASKELLERGPTGETWEVHNQFDPRTRKASVEFLRILVTENRAHIAGFTFRKPEVTPDEKREFMGYLSEAHLVGTKPPSPPTIPAP